MHSGTSHEGQWPMGLCVGLRGPRIPAVSPRQRQCICSRNCSLVRAGLCGSVAPAAKGRCGEWLGACLPGTSALASPSARPPSWGTGISAEFTIPRAEQTAAVCQHGGGNVAAWGTRGMPAWSRGHHVSLCPVFPCPHPGISPAATGKKKVRFSTAAGNATQSRKRKWCRQVFGQNQGDRPPPELPPYTKTPGCSMRGWQRFSTAQKSLRLISGAVCTEDA